MSDDVSRRNASYYSLMPRAGLTNEILKPGTGSPLATLVRCQNVLSSVESPIIPEDSGIMSDSSKGRSSIPDTS
ncbi:hypothetical protein CEXT_797971 [Caerostris extrusa]|uniref:Uncharacterized protein n=1 Tax=Caerostris extrusa TaxID=172846 RepID=A0AAV4V785_CAEEX|nr:hypothetical protein CEXT_797971 [Caerostris extrusa]